ncbi:MAG: hypothetical protein U0271_08395 [Polyangiaceae bacterium]
MQESSRGALRGFSGCLLFVAACGGSDKPHTADSAAPAADRSELQTALVETHKKVVSECFGGFGKGVPYSASFTVSGDSVTAVSLTALVESAVDLPRDCMVQRFQAMKLPAGVAPTLKVRFAVKNAQCAEPACAKDDLPCTFARDIRCSVVVDDG